MASENRSYFTLSNFNKHRIIQQIVRQYITCYVRNTFPDDINNFGYRIEFKRDQKLQCNSVLEACGFKNYVMRMSINHKRHYIKYDIIYIIQIGMRVIMMS